MTQPRVSDDLEGLLRHSAPEVRAAAARIAGKLDLGSLRGRIESLQRDQDAGVREAAQCALERLKPDGGRGGQIVNRHGGYGGLKAHQAAEIAYDATVAFCNRFISLRSRTHDQMVQAARSGKQNIVEGSAAANVSSKTELKLVGVARASFEELLEDYKDFLRQRSLPQWTKDDSRTQEIRKLAYLKDRTYANYRTYIEQESPEVAANTALCLVFQATYLLDRLLKQLEQTFIEEGGLTERMTAARLRYRREQGKG